MTSSSANSASPSPCLPRGRAGDHPGGAACIIAVPSGLAPAGPRLLRPQHRQTGSTPSSAPRPSTPARGRHPRQYCVRPGSDPPPTPSPSAGGQDAAARAAPLAATPSRRHRRRHPGGGCSTQPVFMTGADRLFSGGQLDAAKRRTTAKLILVRNAHIIEEDKKRPAATGTADRAGRRRRRAAAPCTACPVARWYLTALRLAASSLEKRMKLPPSVALTHVNDRVERKLYRQSKKVNDTA